MTDELVSDAKGSTRPTPVRVGVALLDLTKPKQTLLLMITAAGAYALSVPGAIDMPRLLIGVFSLGCAVSGCTALNMVLDRDIDAKMERTRARPLPAGIVSATVAGWWGAALSAAGLALASSMGFSFAAIVAVGLGVDLAVYTAWLKRRTPFSIVLGGVAGGVPALAGRVLAVGRVDAVGLLLAAAVVLWIPAHILTLAIRLEDEYRAAGVPMWPVRYGAGATRLVIALSTIGAAGTLVAAGVLLGTYLPALAALAALGAGLVGLAAFAVARPSLERDWLLFKAASIYMAAAFGCLVVGSAL